MLRCTDKYEVRSVIEEMGYGDILIPLIGIYNKPSEIDYDKLPNEFVAKTTDGGGGNQVLICRDKSTLNCDDFYKHLNEWMSSPKGKNAGREWAYENDYPRRIIIEQLIKVDFRKDLPDYKFFCFEGKPYYCQLIDNRSSEETIDFYNMDWEHQDFVGLNPLCRNSGTIVPKPKNFENLKKIAAKLSNGYPFVRVDLYSVGDKAYFGELTFYPASGFGHFTPDQWDEKLGELIDTENIVGGGKSLISNKLEIKPTTNDLCDYKFFCFGGKVAMVYGVSGRNLGRGAQVGIYTRDFEKLDVVRNDEIAQEQSLPKPLNYERMLEIAENIGRHFPHVRVDLYNVAGRIYFGELTFYDGSGYMTFTPDSYDKDLGNKFDISEFK